VTILCLNCLKALSVFLIATLERIRQRAQQGEGTDDNEEENDDEESSSVYHALLADCKC